MSRRTAIVEEFDDDTDLPLPSQPLPNTGSRGPLLEAVGADASDDEDIDMDEVEEQMKAGPASPSTLQPNAQMQQERQRQVTDITPYKSWTCIYPIYMDAKRPYGTGQRRLPLQKSVWHPLSKDIADAATRLGLSVLHEVNKAHPRDWENPGRVRVLWRKNGRLIRQDIRNKKQLLQSIAAQIHLLKPDSAPKPPYTYAPAFPAPAPPASTKPRSNTKAKPKQGSTPKKVRQPPAVPLSARVSTYSPALASGMLVDTVKAGLNAQEKDAPPPGQGPSAAGKGKRKVVRVRG